MVLKKKFPYKKNIKNTSLDIIKIYYIYFKHF